MQVLSGEQHQFRVCVCTRMWVADAICINQDNTATDASKATASQGCA